MWNHKWNWVPAGMAAVADSSSPAPPRSEADNNELKQRLDQVTGQVRRLQSAAENSRRPANNAPWNDTREPSYKKPRGTHGCNRQSGGNFGGGDNGGGKGVGGGGNGKGGKNGKGKNGKGGKRY